ncbi:MAG: NusG domain II-containing protein [Gammaproteobacteria bacterium]|nr:NusG domain II-containing protein [Gammaproteobacteria bacterium]
MRRWLTLAKPGDAVIFVIALALLVGLWLGLARGDRAWQVDIMRASGADFSVPAWTSQTLHIEGPLGETVIEIARGRARVVSSPCEQKICVLADWLEHAGETAACLPNRVAISLVSADSRFDAVNF